MRIGLPLLIVVSFCAVNAAPEPTSAQVDFFEKKIRPVLVEKCYGCHNSKLKSPFGGLRLDTPEGLQRGGDSGPAVKGGDPGNSRLIQALTYQHQLKMPPSGKLPATQVADFTAWVRDGAPDPRTPGPAVVSSTAGKSIDLVEGRKHWAFQPIRRPVAPPPAPTVIDAFLRARLREQNLTPAPAADKPTLLRRVTYDLTGLPPTTADLDEFLRDTSPGAFAKVVDRLLASPHYGERWARHWLDLMRYAETNGHEYDNDKHEPWRYRDYVIRAFNEGVPYSQFMKEHLAGDLLTAKRLQHGGGTWESPNGTTSLWFNEVLNSATDSEKSKADDVDNQIDVTSKAFLGLTVACARCHDHKFDPIPTADYYAMAGVFHSTDIREAVIDSPERAAKITELSKQIRAINTSAEPPRSAASPSVIEYRPDKDKPFANFDKDFGNWIPQGAAFGDAPVNGSADSRAGGSDVFMGTLTSPRFDTGKHLYLHVRIAGTKTDPKRKELASLRFTIVNAGFKSQTIHPEGNETPKWKTLTLTFERSRTIYFEIVDRARDGHIIVDDMVFSDSKEPPSATDGTPVPEPALDSALLAHRRALEARVPDTEFAMVAEDRNPHNVRLHIRGNHKNLGDEVPRRFLQVLAGTEQPAVPANTSGRLELAQRLASPDNPLPARVMVNRIWKHHFGSGLVRTTDNFGKMGELPTHPELLEYLAGRFIDSNWSVKAIHREILLAAAYQQSSTPGTLALQVDPANKLLQHMPVRRLEAEAIRDAVLSVSGALDRTLYGPSIVPFISAWQNGRGKPESGPLDGAGRRSIYIQVRRNFLTPMFLAFDYPSPISAIGTRTVSTVPSQALMMMNNEFVHAQAKRWASRVVAEVPADPAERIRRMYKTAYARPAEQSEIDTILAFAKEPRPESEVWTDIAHVLLNSAEFLYVQ
ncbi:MAG: PSD1 and planctomycete cytochrome C domain-containing protein [Bryobacteraceae bacterium]|nr:PSD1 and planctomycete cytochrome C domain-containing protein [Bryobacteraceae bacterium]